MCAEKVDRLAADRLFVADVGEDRPEDRQLRSLFRRHVQAGLGHRREEPRGFERHGLAAGVRARDDEHARRRRQHHVHRNHDVGTGSGVSRRGPAVRARVRPRSSSSGCRAPTQLQRAVGCSGPARRPPSSARSAPWPARRRAPSRPRWCARRSSGRARNASVSASRMRRTSSASRSSSSTISLLIVHRPQRLEEQAGAAGRRAVHHAGDGAAMLRLAPSARSARCGR